MSNTFEMETYILTVKCLFWWYADSKTLSWSKSEEPGISAPVTVVKKN